jgi:hypothetical protein
MAQLENHDFKLNPMVYTSYSAQPERGYNAFFSAFQAAPG